MDPARQALRPVREELAVRIGRESPRKEARPPAQNRRRPDRKGVQKAPLMGASQAPPQGVYARLRGLWPFGAPLPSSREQMRAIPRAHWRRRNVGACPTIKIIASIVAA